MRTYHYKDKKSRVHKNGYFARYPDNTWHYFNGTKFTKLDAGDVEYLSELISDETVIEFRLKKRIG